MVRVSLPILEAEGARLKRLAIIGTGIAGMYCGHRLQGRYDLTVYEANDYAGGHTNTVEVTEQGRALPVDTGFMVFNKVTYPNLTALFEALQVPIKPTSMSFSVQHRPSGLEFCGSGFNGLFAQRGNLLRPSFWRLLSEIGRFNAQAARLLDEPGSASLTLAAYARREGFSEAFLQHYLIPMSSAVWSTPPDQMLRFPAVTLVRFFKNHGFLGMNTQHPWWTVEGGSRAYRDRIIAGYRDRILLQTPAVRVVRESSGVMVEDGAGGRREFDFMIIAAHADQALALLDRPTDQERRLLSPFRYQSNQATLHTDRSVMPETRRAWSSWNYRTDNVDGHPRSSTVYWMNSLQGVSHDVDYFVSINDPGVIAPSAVLRQITYTHPVFSVEAMEAQRQLPQLNESGPIYFCGSYFRYGFHEDALVSAMDVVPRLEDRA